MDEFKHYFFKKVILFNSYYHYSGELGFLKDNDWDVAVVNFYGGDDLLTRDKLYITRKVGKLFWFDELNILTDWQSWHFP